MGEPTPTENTHPAAKRRKAGLRGELVTFVKVMVSLGLLVPGAGLVIGAKPIVMHHYGGRGDVFATAMFQDGQIYEKIEFVTLLVQAIGAFLGLAGLVLLVVAAVGYRR